MVNNCRALSLELSGVAKVRASSRTVWSPVAGSSPIRPNAARRRAGEMLWSTARFTMLGSKYAFCMTHRPRLTTCISAARPKRLGAIGPIRVELNHSPRRQRLGLLAVTLAFDAAFSMSRHELVWLAGPPELVTCHYHCLLGAFRK